LPAALNCGSKRAVSFRALTALILLQASAAVLHAELVPCREPSDARPVAEALARLRAATDPCGESAELTAVLDTLARCPTARYEICVTAGADRNLFDRPNTRDGVRTIRWNPELSSELEARCDDGAPAVRREPTASLLHEVAHAADDCAGRDPGQHELDAVRIENIYRRAAGLAQRAGYGAEPLPPSMRRSCEPASCTCGLPAAPEAARVDPTLRIGPIADDPIR
jgi:hypothetical protein